MQFCDSKGLPKAGQTDNGKTTSFATVVGGRLEWLQHTNQQKIWTVGGLHKAAMFQIVKDKILTIRHATDIDDILMLNTYLDNYELPSVLLFHDEKTAPAWFFDVVYNFKKDFIFRMSTGQNDLKALENPFLHIEKGFQMENYPELLILLPIPTECYHVHNSTLDQKHQQKHGNAEVLVTATERKYDGEYMIIRLNHASAASSTYYKRIPSTMWDEILKDEEIWKARVNVALWINLSLQDDENEDNEKINYDTLLGAFDDMLFHN